MALIAVDFDHTLVNTPGTDALPGAREAISRFREAGHKIIIHSCNNPKWIEKTLNNLDIRYDYLWGSTGLEGGKPVADLYVDNKGFHFTDWAKDTDTILDLMKQYDNRKTRLLR